MGSVESSTHAYAVDYKGVDPAAQPKYLHEILADDMYLFGIENSARENMQRALSRVKACKQDAVGVQQRLRNEYFSEWRETCEVTEARQMSVYNLEGFFSKMEQQYSGVNFDIRKKLEGIRWTPTWSHKVFEFTFGDNIDSGEVYFGIICLAKSPDGQKVDAVSSLYKLNFTLAKEKVVTRETVKFLGFIPVDTTTSVHYRSKNLGYFSKKQITNFCRVKAMEAFKSKGFIDRVPYVTSLSAIDN